MLKNEVVQTMSLNIKFSYLAKNSKFSRSNSCFLILTPTFLRDGFLNSYFQNPSENSDVVTYGLCKLVFSGPLGSKNRISIQNLELVHVVGMSNITQLTYIR